MKEKIEICRICGEEYLDGVDGKDGVCLQCWQEAQDECEFRYGMGWG